MLYAQYLAYTQQTSSDKHYLSIVELQQIAAHSGHNFLLKLDGMLRLTVLNGFSQEDIQALLVLCWTILAAGYA
jgi:hypothetical protein